jgi:H+/Cl- antiporter ClcA
MVSAKGGEAAESWSETADPAEAKVEVTSSGRTSLEAEISGQESPFWLVLGQSFNEGWVVTINGRDMGSPQLVDGFANGWFVDPVETGTLEVSFKWAPQKNIWVALSISLVGILICLCLIYRERRQKSVQLCLDTPTLHNPRMSTYELSQKEALVASLLLGLFGAFVSNPLIGALVACLTWISARNFRRRILLTLLPVAGYCIGVAYIIFLQIKWEYEPAFSWPSWGRSVHHLGLLVVLLVTADVIVTQISERFRRQKKKGETL